MPLQIAVTIIFLVENLAVALMAIFGCSPESADSDECEVKAGDLLLVATDGVFDNLPVSSILRYLQPVRDSSDLSDLQAAANSIAKEAREHAFDERYMSPFAVNARMAGINAIGKGDDFACLLCLTIMVGILFCKNMLYIVLIIFIFSSTADFFYHSIIYIFFFFFGRIINIIYKKTFLGFPRSYSFCIIVAM